MGIVLWPLYLEISTSAEDNSGLNPSEEPILRINRDSMEACVRREDDNSIKRSVAVISIQWEIPLTSGKTLEKLFSNNSL